MTDPLDALPGEVTRLLDSLTEALRETLGERIVGTYLFGSAARGGFDRESDIDVVVVTESDVADDEFAALQAMHTRIASTDSLCATQLEVSYIPRAALRRYAPPNILHPRLDRGRGETLHFMSHDADWVVQRYLIREHGVALHGPPPDTLVDPVSPQQLRFAMRELVQEWLSPLIENPPTVRTRGYQSFLVLSVCRILYTLEHGAVISKRDAAVWGEQILDTRWRSLITGAWTGRQNPDGPPAADDLTETWEFVRFALTATGR